MIALFYLTLMYGDFALTTSAASGTFSNVQIQRFGPMSQGECLQAASDIGKIPKFLASCSNGSTMTFGVRP